MAAEVAWGRGTSPDKPFEEFFSGSESEGVFRCPVSRRVSQAPRQCRVDSLRPQRAALPLFWNNVVKSATEFC